MNKKKVDSILKGVAATGVALGGATVVQNADVVYAAEMQNVGQQEKTQVLGSESESASTKASESASTSVATSVSQRTSLSEEALKSMSAVNSEIISQMGSAKESLSTENSEISRQSLSASLSAADSASKSESMSISLSTSTSEKMEEVNSAYDSTSAAFKDYENSYLENLIKQIKEAQKVVADNKKDAELNHRNDLSKSGYYRAADQLANLLIQYKFYQEDNVKEIKFSDWNSNSKEKNYVVVKYIDKNGKEQYAYFDYITVNKSDIRVEKNKANQVDHIYVLQKTPKLEFESKDWFGNYNNWDKLTYKFDENNNKIFYHNGKKINDSKAVTGNEIDGYYYKKNVYYFTGNFVDNSGEGVKGKRYFSEKDFDRGATEYDKKRKDYTSASEAKSQAESESESVSVREASLSASASVSTSYSGRGKRCQGSAAGTLPAETYRSAPRLDNRCAKVPPAKSVHVDENSAY